jgi:hypothetical protein
MHGHGMDAGVQLNPDAGAKSRVLAGFRVLMPNTGNPHISRMLQRCMADYGIIVGNLMFI